MNADQEKSLFLASLAIESVEERISFVEQACANNPAMFDRLRALLEAQAANRSFLEQPAAVATTNMPPVAEKPGTEIGPYKLREQIGEGGFGVVYVAEQEKPVARKVALKIIKLGMDTKDVVARFEAERQALALMEHPNIARVFDAGATESGRPYFVMELVKGVPITEFCDERKLSTRERLPLFVDVCRAVQHAHQKGIIHRDLKPSNVMVTLHDDKPVVKVIDFGVSKALASKLTEKTVYTAYGQLVGTPMYMSPEQAQFSGLDVDTRSDVYSLGVLLYELLTGTTPFHKATLLKSGFDEMRRIIREIDPPRPSARISTLRGEMLSTVSGKRTIDPRKLSRSLRGELDWIVMKALEKDRNRRYESASAFAADVERYQADEPVQACPASVGYRFGKFARRNKSSLSVAAMVLFFLVILGTTVGWALHDREMREQDLARKAERELALKEQGVRQGVEQAVRIRGELHDVLAKPGGVQALLNQPGRWKFLIQSARSELAQALRSASRAEDRLSPELTQALRKLDEQLASDAANRLLALRLEKIRVNRAEYEALKQLSTVYGLNNQTTFDDRQAAEQYALALEQFAVLEKDAAAVALSLRSSPIREQLVAALDDWAYVAFITGNQTSAEKILAVVRQAAPDPGWGDRVRDVKIWRDREALGKLVEEATTTGLSPQVCALIGSLLSFESHIQQSWLRRAQRQFPSDFWLNLQLGYALRRTQPSEAVGFLRVALAVRPENPASYNNLGLVLSDLNKFDEAVACLQKAIELAPKNPCAHNFLGLVLRDHGRLDGAVIEFQKTIALDPKYANAWCNLGLTLHKQKKFDEALDAIDTAIKIYPKFPRAICSRGLVLADQNKLDAAIAAFRKAIELKPDYPHARQNLRNALSKQRTLQRRSAVAAYREAIKLNPRDASAHIKLGVVLRDQGKFNAATAAFRKAVDIDPMSFRAYYSLGLLLREQNRLDPATAAFSTAIKLKPKHHSDYFLGRVATNLANLILERKQSDPIRQLKRADWAVLKPIEMKSPGGEKFTIEKDGSIFVSGPNPQRAVYTLKFKPETQLIGAIRLETLPDTRLRKGTAGRYPGNGSFHLAEFTAAVDSLDGATSSEPIPFARAFADFYAYQPRTTYVPQRAIDGNPKTHWEAWPKLNEPHWVAVIPEAPVRMKNGYLTITLDSGINRWGKHGLGRFRLSILDDSAAQSLPALYLTNPWERLAAAYHVSNDQAALDKLTSERPESILGLAGLTSKPMDVKRITAVCNKLLQSGTANRRTATLKAVARMGSLGKNTVPSVLLLLDDKNTAVQKRAAVALTAIGESAVEALVTQLQDKSSARRLRAITVLTEFGPPAKSALPALSQTLNDQDKTVAKAAAQAIKSIEATPRRDRKASSPRK